MPQSPPCAAARSSRPSLPARPDAAMTRSALQRGAVDPDSAGAAAVGAHLVDVPDAQRQPRLVLGGGAQHPLEGQPAAPDSHQLLRSCRTRPTGGIARKRDRLGARGEQVVPHVRQFRLQRLHHLCAEGVRVVELHHPASGPRPVLLRPRVPVHDGDLVPSTGEHHRGEQPGRPRTDNNNSHRPHPRDSVLRKESAAPRAVIHREAAGRCRPPPTPRLRRGSRRPSNGHIGLPVVGKWVGMVPGGILMDSYVIVAVTFPS